MPDIASTRRQVRHLRQTAAKRTDLRQQLIEADYGYTKITNLVSEWRKQLIDITKNES